jgi:16S rRNA (uracil1498-N3)-methyltransferase|tara:strand:+ start:16786 stop:17418 length:633 start_codon:yes stop_codon:yes gene_type:complete
MKVGQSAILFNGEGGQYIGRLTNASKTNSTVLIDGFSAVEKESNLKIHLAVGVSKGDRMDWIIQKATELGVTEISPIFTGRTEVKLSGSRLDKKLSHWQQIAISACEQSQRNRVPSINPILSFDDWLELKHNGLKLLMNHLGDLGLSEISPKDQNIVLLVGPEGGLSENEICVAEASGYTSVSMGPRILRTETAPVAALSILQSLWGDMA